MTPKITAIAVDDEFPALELLRRYCGELAEVDLLRTFQNPLEARSYLENNAVDLVLLDIQMPQLNGIALLEGLANKPLCIFLTLETGYAIKAFELDVIHYLVKPVDFQTFAKAVRKAVDMHHFRNTMKVKERVPFIMFKSNLMMHKVPLEDVLWVEGYNEYIRLIAVHKVYVILERLANFLRDHEHLGFMRIHKSYLVIGHHVTSYNAKQVRLKNGQELPIGRAYTSAVRTHFTRFD